MCRALAATQTTTNLNDSFRLPGNAAFMLGCARRGCGHSGFGIDWCTTRPWHWWKGALFFFLIFFYCTEQIIKYILTLHEATSQCLPTRVHACDRVHPTPHRAGHQSAGGRDVAHVCVVCDPALLPAATASGSGGAHAGGRRTGGTSRRVLSDWRFYGLVVCDFMSLPTSILDKCFNRSKGSYFQEVTLFDLIKFPIPFFIQCKS